MPVPESSPSLATPRALPRAGLMPGLAGAGVCALACTGLWGMARTATPDAGPAWAPTALLLLALAGLLGQVAASVLQWRRQQAWAGQEQTASQRRRQATQQLLDALPMALALCEAHDEPQRPVPNAALVQLLGGNPAAAERVAPDWASLLAVQDLPPWQAAWTLARRSGRPQGLECSLQGPGPAQAMLAQITPCSVDSQPHMLVCLTPLQGDGGLAQQTLLQLRQLLALTEGEKWHFGQAVHDELGQRLSGMAYFAKALQRKLLKAQRAEAEDAGWLTDLANESMAVARGLARGLLPVGSDDPGALGAALADLCDRAGKTFGIACTLTVAPAFDAGDAARASHLYHAVQELMNNAVKHGQARRLQVQLQVLGDSQRVTVDDDGSGLPPAPLRRGLGLAGVRSRAAYLGAQFAIANKPGGGVQAHLEWPLAATPPALPANDAIPP